MLETFERFQNSKTNFDMNLFGENVGEKIYTEILNQL